MTMETQILIAKQMLENNGLFSFIGQFMFSLNEWRNFPSGSVAEEFARKPLAARFMSLPEWAQEMIALTDKDNKWLKLTQ